jgi:3-hydroxyacyl-CoA dehydrogenase
MNSIDPDVLNMIGISVETVQQHFKGLIISGDSDNFSVGANIGFFLYAVNLAAWPMMSDVIRDGQRAMMALKYAPFPVVAGLHGMALGGGCEMILHCDGVQAHVESYPGLVETGIGVIPGWGGCKEMLVRGYQASQGQGGPMPIIQKVFEMIAMARVGTSADEAAEMMILPKGKFGITMNRARLLHDAKTLCLQLAQNYEPPKPTVIAMPGKTGETALKLGLEGFVKTGKATPHDQVVATGLSRVLSGGDADITTPVTEQYLLGLEHEVFMDLIKTKATVKRIEHMLNTGKPLRN